MRRLVLFFLLCSTGFASAQEIGPWVGLYTYHISRDDEVNERNNLIGLRYGRWFGARFENSFNEPSYVVGYRLLQRDVVITPRTRAVFGLSPGVAYGYGEQLSATYAGFTPGLVPSAGLEWQVTDLWSLGKDILYIWTDNGGVLLGGISLVWHRR